VTVSRRQARRQALFLHRLGAVERSALRVAVHELETQEVPAEVAINEAVAFTKRYASEDGARLVNGILGRIQREAA
jgi:N utilization substance protein B